MLAAIENPNKDKTKSKNERVKKNLKNEKKTK